MKTNAYLIIGDSFLVEEKSKEIIRQIEQEVGGEIFKQSFYLTEKSIEEILWEAHTLPFLVTAQIFTIFQSEKLKKTEIATLAQYLDQPQLQTCLLFCSDNIDRRGGFDKLIAKKGGKVVLFSHAEKQSVGARFINQKLKQFNKEMSSASKRKLELMVGDAPSFLDSILTQLILYAGELNVITDEMLELFEEKVSGIDVFKLANAIAGRQTDAALRLYNEYMEESGKDIFSLMGLLHWQLRRLWQARILLDEDVPQSSILKRCRISPQQGKYFFEQVRCLSRDVLEKGIENLFQLDQGIKTGQAQDRFGLEKWIVELTA